MTYGSFFTRLLSGLNQPSRQEVELLEGRVWARGLTGPYWSALLIATHPGGFRFGAGLGNATLRQRYQAAKQALGEA